ncbi:MAG TPA: SDR family NAD(P)-dependent oxidoreductase [Candidatus Limnocylindria bacterium]|nr:SDR family NAD(P)-dependent oxidoreductase [Candidatus Limnocylindria bacterium]
MATPRAALVTGGTGALGQAIVRRLLAEGATVTVPYIVDAERERLLAAVGEHDRARITLQRADVTDDRVMGDLVRSVTTRHGGVHILVSAVGGFAGGALVDTDRATWDHMIALNLTSVFVAARAAVPGMVAGGYGRIVIIASRAVVPPSGGFIAYTAAKAGVIAFTQALATEVKAAGVTANAVLPSTMDTPANRAAMPGADPKTWVPVEAVADAVGFLAAESSGHITGTSLAI